MILLALIVGAIAFDHLCSLVLSNVVQNSQYRLYKLRDDLRELAMRGEVKPENWVFQYLDSTIAKTISVLPELHLWRVAAMTIWSNRDKEASGQRTRQLHSELQKQKNSELRKMHEQYTSELAYFLIQRHSTLRFTATNLVRIRRVSLLKRKWATLFKAVLATSPETSTFPEYAPRAKQFDLTPSRRFA